MSRAVGEGVSVNRGLIALFLRSIRLEWHNTVYAWGGGYQGVGTIHFTMNIRGTPSG